MKLGLLSSEFNVYVYQNLHCNVIMGQCWCSSNEKFQLWAVPLLACARRSILYIDNAGLYCAYDDIVYDFRSK
jgi:hypothetical protein